jgi:predicted Zn-ribbon and HTH transcriptional regulator
MSILPKVHKPVKGKTYLTVYYFRYIVPVMAKRKITVYQYTCERCRHDWIPRDIDNEPRVCPKCKSPYWNKPRRAERA